MMETVRVIEKCRISPPPNTVGEKSLSLTFFDYLWLPLPPTHQLFFYDFPHSRPQTLVPSLKHSLSVALQHFFPFAGNLIVFPAPTKPEIRHVEGDSVALTFAESTDLDFNHLIGNHPRECNKFHPLIPLLEPASKVESESAGFVKIPVFCVQVTIFPNSGFTLGITNNHGLCDARSKYDFLRAWASITKYGTDESFLATGSLPLFDRPIKFPQALDHIYLNMPGIQSLGENYRPFQLPDIDRVRATFVFTRPHIIRLKKWVSVQLPTLEYVSSFTLACGYVWSCIAKSRSGSGSGSGSEHEVERFGCVIDWRGRMDPPLPQTYFGNCVGFCFAPIQTSMLTGNKGLVDAVEVLGKAISEAIKNKQGMLKDAETWLERGMLKVPTMGVSGTPKLDIYDLDFGWGKPKKHEVVSMDYGGDSISVNVSNESPEDLEIGLCLPAKQMDAFITISRNELQSIASEEAS